MQAMCYSCTNKQLITIFLMLDTIKVYPLLRKPTSTIVWREQVERYLGKTSFLTTLQMDLRVVLSTCNLPVLTILKCMLNLFSGR